MVARVDTLQDDFENLQKYNPIEHVKSRIKTPESIARKLHRRNLAITDNNVRKELTDVAGLRCICSYARDIPHIVDIFRGQPDIEILREKDYISTRKESGYRSYHLIINVPIYLTDTTKIIPVEVQIRTQAMDFWATLEHKVRYKYKNEIPPHISYMLVQCADEIAKLDRRMYSIQEYVDTVY